MTTKANDDGQPNDRIVSAFVIYEVSVPVAELLGDEASSLVDDALLHAAEDALGDVSGMFVETHKIDSPLVEDVEIEWTESVRA